jgi:hypothetical protein
MAFTGNHPMFHSFNFKKFHFIECSRTYSTPRPSPCTLRNVTAALPMAGNISINKLDQGTQVGFFSCMTTTTTTTTEGTT